MLKFDRQFADKFGYLLAGEHQTEKGVEYLEITAGSVLPPEFCRNLHKLDALSVLAGEDCVFSENAEFPDSLRCLRIPGCKLDSRQQLWPKNLEWLDWSQPQTSHFPDLQKNPTRIYARNLHPDDFGALIKGSEKIAGRECDVLDISGSAFSEIFPSRIFQTLTPEVLILDRCDDINSESAKDIFESFYGYYQAGKCRFVSMRNIPMDFFSYPIFIQGEPFKNYILKGTPYVKNRLEFLTKLGTVKPAPPNIAASKQAASETWIDLSESDIQYIEINDEDPDIALTTFWV